MCGKATVWIYIESILSSFDCRKTEIFCIFSQRQCQLVIIYSYISLVITISFRFKRALYLQLYGFITSDMISTRYIYLWYLLQTPVAPLKIKLVTHMAKLLITHFFSPEIEDFRKLWKTPWFHRWCSLRSAFDRGLSPGAWHGWLHGGSHDAWRGGLCVFCLFFRSNMFTCAK